MWKYKSEKHLEGVLTHFNVSTKQNLKSNPYHYLVMSINKFCTLNTNSEIVHHTNPWIFRKISWTKFGNRFQRGFKVLTHPNGNFEQKNDKCKKESLFKEICMNSPDTDSLHWWLVRVTLVVAWWLFASKFWEVAGTYK